jgi:hypothetical protein
MNDKKDTGSKQKDAPEIHIRSTKFPEVENVSKEAEAEKVPQKAVVHHNPDLDSQWARENSAMAPDFIEKFYKSSRLHYLSTWKNALRSKTKVDLRVPKDEERFIM